LPHALHATTANVTDRDGALAMFEIYAPNLSGVAKTLVDGGYTGEKFATAVHTLLGAEVDVVKRNELHTFAVIPKRWVVERTFAWLENYRRLWKNCERKLSNSLQMTILAFLRLLLKRAQ
jgi:transposase